MGTDSLYYIMDYSEHYYRTNQADQLVAAAGEQDATVFTLAQANRHIGVGKKASFYCMVPIEEQTESIVDFSLIENKLIRSNRKVTSMNNIHFPTDKRSREEPMMVTYLEKGRLLLLKNEIDVYIVNMALNLIIDKEEPEDKGGAKLFFKDDENCPMYIVSRIFLDEKQAELELEHALNNKDSYINANTLIEYIKESHESYLAEK